MASLFQVWGMVLGSGFGVSGNFGGLGIQGFQVEGYAEGSLRVMLPGESTI